MRKRLREGSLDDKEIEIELAERAPTLDIMGPQGMEEMAEQLKGLFSQMGSRQAQDPQAEGRRGAAKLLVDEEAGKLVNEDEIRAQALHNAEQNGIVFIDEIDKVARAPKASGAEVSAARACSATCCRWSRAPPSAPSTAWSRPTTSCSSPRRLPPGQAQRPDPRAAGALPDPRGAGPRCRAWTTSRPS
jgi:hypothetical protein